MLTGLCGNYDRCMKTRYYWQIIALTYFIGISVIGNDIVYHFTGR